MKKAPFGLGSQGRLVTAKQLREYLGVSSATLARMREAGTMPKPVPGTRLYDSVAVYRMLDKRAGIDREAEAAAEAEQRLIERSKMLWGKDSQPRQRARKPSSGD